MFSFSKIAHNTLKILVQFNCQTQVFYEVYSILLIFEVL